MRAVASSRRPCSAAVVPAAVRRDGTAERRHLQGAERDHGPWQTTRSWVSRIRQRVKRQTWMETTHLAAGLVAALVVAAALLLLVVVVVVVVVVADGVVVLLLVVVDAVDVAVVAPVAGRAASHAPR